MILALKLADGRTDRYICKLHYALQVYMLQRTHNNRVSLIVACLAKNFRRSIEPKSRKLAEAINTSDLQWRAVRIDYRPAHTHIHTSEFACGSPYTVCVNTG